MTTTEQDEKVREALAAFGGKLPVTVKRPPTRPAKATRPVTGMDVLVAELLGISRAARLVPARGGIRVSRGKQCAETRRACACGQEMRPRAGNVKERCWWVCDNCGATTVTEKGVVSDG